MLSVLTHITATDVILVNFNQNEPCMATANELIKHVVFYEYQGERRTMWSTVLQQVTIEGHLSQVLPAKTNHVQGCGTTSRI